MQERARKSLIVGAAVFLLGCAYLALYRFAGFGIPCIFHLITGLNCPGCGVTRMMHSLVHLDFVSAFHHNAALLCLSPILFILFASRAYRYIRYGSVKTTRLEQISCWALVAILLLWGVVRNVIGM